MTTAYRVGIQGARDPVRVTLDADDDAGALLAARAIAKLSDLPPPPMVYVSGTQGNSWTAKAGDKTILINVEERFGTCGTANSPKRRVLVVEILLDNEATRDAYEVGCLLRKVARKVDDGFEGLPQKIHDVNGNLVGMAEIEERLA